MTVHSNGVDKTKLFRPSRILLHFKGMICPPGNRKKGFFSLDRPKLPQTHPLLVGRKPAMRTTFIVPHNMLHSFRITSDPRVQTKSTRKYPSREPSHPWTYFAQAVCGQGALISIQSAFSTQLLFFFFVWRMTKQNGECRRIFLF